MSELDKYGGRRFLLACAVILVTSLLTWFTKISGEVYSTVTITTITALIIGNTTEGVKKITVAGSGTTTTTSS